MLLKEVWNLTSEERDLKRKIANVFANFRNYYDYVFQNKVRLNQHGMQRWNEFKNTYLSL